ncbi:HlyD family efflux transporter periplasmic adaptor subunit [Polynucleobacter sp. MWH-Svant-W18]|uniref:HlyD family efflux transporter periplasmic adaptor subunit n=1 Tax=Polynucleobacter sp. MWH-Svant-W18 TaxID=1855909 RepID=UPI00203E8717|nr:HlyD family efflux transporter periplasmic adaptor subunit [Polynucleobacter sp. MWH-Svant-W18]QWD77368.1 HlyD family efflux transporter periplasmic adaptor subunit [Polynucleobacter sp. MWH-Svant-W18]
MNEPVQKDSAEQAVSTSSQEQANTAATNSSKTEDFKASTALVVGNAANITKQAVSTAMTKLSEGYVEWHDLRTGKKDEKYFSWLGWQILIWGFGGALLWAFLAPIEKGVSASGYVITDSNRKAIQPAFAGVVDDIFVKEGQQVKAGEVLVKLNPISAKAQANATKETIDGLDAQVKGLSQAIAQKKQQSALLERQLVGLRELAAEGYMAKNKVLELERQQLQLKASILEDEGNLIRTKKQMSEQQEKLNPYEYDLANTELRSPVNGQVVNITIFTKGGVVSPGQKLMEVVPTNEAMIVEGQLPVHLVDKVHVDLPVEMMFTAFNTNRTPHIPGVLISVGADRIVDEKTGNPYYKIQAITTAQGAKLLKDLKVRPGMPVELFVKTGEQSMMTYLMKPVFDRAHSAMRED